MPIKHSKDHKMKSGKREISESICDNPKCKFYGKRAAQGVCFDPTPDMAEKYWNQIIQSGEDILREMKALRKRNKVDSPAKWIKYLEGHVICTWANNSSLLDEVVALRAENAKLRVKLGKWK